MAQDETQQLHRQILIETLGSVLWFLLDGFWMLDLPLVAKALVLPTLGVNLLVFRYTHRSVSQLSVVAAMNAWLLMNIFWMFGEIDEKPAFLTAARGMFALGVTLLVVAFARDAADPSRRSQLLLHFRRLRM